MARVDHGEQVHGIVGSHIDLVKRIRLSMRCARAARAGRTGAATVPEAGAWANERTSRLASESGRSRSANDDRISVGALTRPFFGQTGMTAGLQGHRGICNAETTWTLHESGSIGRQPMILLDLLTE